MRRRELAVLAFIGLILFFPGLTSFGLWDPHEIRVADAARAVALKTEPAYSAVQQLGRPPLPVWLVAWGFRGLGVGELGGRLPIAAVSLLTLLAVFYAGAPLVGRRGAFFGAFALATTPWFLLGARQLTTDAPLVLGAALAVGGLARALAPAPGTSAGQRVADLLLAAVGLAIGQASLGILVGVIAPLLTVALALHLEAGRRWAVALELLLLGGTAALLALHRKAGYSSLMGGLVHAPLHTTTVSTSLVRTGFQLFPWVALLPPALLSGLGAGDPPNERRGPAEADRGPLGVVLLSTWVVVTYVAATIQGAMVQEVHAPLAPAVLLLVGGFLSRSLEEPRPLPFAGLCAALGAVIVGHDFFSTPEQFVGLHIHETVRWPAALTPVPYVIMAAAAFFGGVVGLGLGAPLASDPATGGARKRLPAGLVRLLARLGGAPEPEGDGASLLAGRRLLLGAGGLAAFALVLTTAHWIVPQLSKHLSARELYGKARMLDPNAPVGQYRFSGSGASYYAGGRVPETLGTVKDVFTFLARPERVFVMAGAEELPAIAQEARQRQASYFVIDDSNSRTLVLSNRLGPKEQDLNPLKRFISDTPPKPGHVVEADFEGKVRLLGYDLPDPLQRGQDFKIRLYFQVLQPLGANYKVFLHFDGPGTRFNGDHVPLEGRFPTPHWTAGSYITDEHELKPDRATQPTGAYRIFMGFFSGDSRLKVTSGPQDGENRVKLGGVVIK